MKIFSMFAVCLFMLALTMTSLAQDPTQDSDSNRPRKGRHRGEGGGGLKRLDNNNDGQISRDEWKGSSEAFDKLDANKDGKISREEGAQARRERAGRALKEMDSNGDGQLSSDEWKGNPEVFKRLDANGD